MHCFSLLQREMLGFGVKRYMEVYKECVKSNGESEKNMGRAIAPDSIPDSVRDQHG